MGSISKHSLNSETSSEESDQREKFKEESDRVGRFYECNFCKRGFTNAQALGGHMNIHRKDRVKVKQNAPKSSFSNKSGEECMNPRYFEHLSSDHQQYFAVTMGGQMNCQFYLPTSNPTFSLGYDHLPHLSDSTTLRTEHLSLFEDHKTANLSMQIDNYSDHQEDSEGRNTNWKENEVDLELRLG